MKSYEELILAHTLCGKGETGCSVSCPYLNSLNCMAEKAHDTLACLKGIEALKAAASEMYEKGLNDAWEVAEKIVFIDKNGGFTCKEFNEIFGNKNKGEVFEMTPTEVIKMIQLWEETKDYHVGDVVKYNDVLDMMENANEKGVIIHIDKTKAATVLWNSKKTGTYPLKELSLTGEHLDISSVFTALTE